MAWQRQEQADAVISPFPPDAAQTAIVDELAPAPGEPVFDKLGMSALVGTPLEAALRDRGVTTLILVGAVLEIGIEPTARHAADLGLLPVVVDDACGIVEESAAQRSLDSLDYSLMSYRATTAEVVAAFRGSTSGLRAATPTRPCSAAYPRNATTSISVCAPTSIHSRLPRCHTRPKTSPIAMFPVKPPRPW